MTDALNFRHQKNGVVIARCSQPEISWWGWRNTDDEYLVTSIAKACQMGTKGACGAPACRQRGEAPDSCDSDFGKETDTQICNAVHVYMYMDYLYSSRVFVCVQFSIPLYGPLVQCNNWSQSPCWCAHTRPTKRILSLIYASIIRAH